LTPIKEVVESRLLWIQPDQQRSRSLGRKRGFEHFGSDPPRQQIRQAHGGVLDAPGGLNRR
jgi:hypothetical protein